MEVESGFTEDSARRRLADVTGGWPVLVDEVEGSARNLGARRALDALEASLPERAAWLLDQVGVTDGVLAGGWATAEEILGVSGREPAEALAEFLAVDDVAGDIVVQALVLAGVLIDYDGQLGVEPVVAEAWARRTT